MRETRTPKQLIKAKAQEDILRWSKSQVWDPAQALAKVLLKLAKDLHTLANSTMSLLGPSDVAVIIDGNTGNSDQLVELVEYAIECYVHCTREEYLKNHSDSARILQHIIAGTLDRVVVVLLGVDAPLPYGQITAMLCGVCAAQRDREVIESVVDQIEVCEDKGETKQEPEKTGGEENGKSKN